MRSNLSTLKQGIIMVLLGVLLFGSGNSIATAAPPHAPMACSGLFFSEYIEGSSNNKAIEIYNGTGAAVDLGDYTVELYNNGNTSPNSTRALSGSLSDGDVYVIAHSNANAAIQAEADLLLGGGIVGFNGNDVFVLRDDNTGNVVDSIGEIGNSNTFAANVTLRRQAGISTGDTNPNDAFDPADEWDSYAQDNSDDLGSHTATCFGSGDAAPSIASTTPSDGATGVAVNADILINFSENVNVAGSWYQISCTTSGVHTAAVSGGPQNFTLNPDTDFSMNETCTVTVYAAQVTDQDTDDPPDNMDADESWSFTTVGAPAPCSTIPQIQGDGNSSPCTGHRDNIQGCITGVGGKGFYFQDVNGDGDTDTSDGIYAYFWSSWNNPAGLAAGDLVQVSGNVTEYYDATEFAHSGSDPLSVTVIGSCTLPAPVSISPNTDPNADPMTLYEQYEGMRVQMSFDGFVVGPTTRFVSRFTPGDPEIAFVDQGSPIYGQRVFQDDYNGYQGINYISGGFNKDLPDVGFGDTLAATNLVGVLGYHFDKYTLLVDGGTNHTYTVGESTQSPLLPIAIDDEEFAVCSFNLENLFDHIDDGDGDMGDWTPADAAEYDAMLEKRAKAIANDLNNCTVIAVQEVEGKDPVWDDLVVAISAQGGINYSYDYYESTDPRDITVGILYDPARVTLNASSQEQGCTSTNYNVNYGNADNTYGRVVSNPCSGGTYALFNRPPYLGQLTITNAAGSSSVNVSVIANHFKSKRGNESTNLPRREDQAQHVVDVMTAEDAAGRPNVIALGDFNDTLDSTPLAAFNTNVGGEPLVNLYPSHVPDNERYSFIFSGESEVLDHFITTGALNAYFMHGRTIHINADFPEVDTLANDNCSSGICIFSPLDSTSRRSSDHDPVFVRFGFPLTADWSDLESYYGLARHAGAHTLWLGDGVDDDSSAANGSDDSTDTGIDRAAGPGPGGQWQNGSNGAAVDVTLGGSGNGCLHAWVDWDGDGTFEEGDEHIIQGVVSGAGNYTFDVPSGTFPGSGSNLSFDARFRLYANCPAEAAPYGTALNGEVEDYTWAFTPTAVALVSFDTRESAPWLLPAVAVALLLLLAAGLSTLRHRFSGCCS